MTNYASQAKFNNYNPVAIGWGGAHDPEAHPSLLVDFSYAGVSFGKMHRDAVGLFTALLDELVPLIPGGLKDGSCGCYNPNSKLQDGSRSFHTFAIAIDVDWNVNHMGTNLPSPTGEYAIPHAAAEAIAHKYGCEYGGTDWGSFNDDMHFEIHLSPKIAAAITPEDIVTPQDKQDIVDAVVAALHKDDVVPNPPNAGDAKTNKGLAVATVLSGIFRILNDISAKIDKALAK